MMRFARQLLALLTIALPAFAAPADQVSWVKEYDEALRQAAAGKKPLVVDFSASWCGFCKKMEMEVYPDPEFVQFSRSAVYVRYFTDKDPEGARLARIFEVRGFPTIVILDPRGEEVERLMGARDKATLIRDLTEIFAKAVPPPKAAEARPAKPAEATEADKAPQAPATGQSEEPPSLSGPPRKKRPSLAGPIPTAKSPTLAGPIPAPSTAPAAEPPPAKTAPAETPTAPPAPEAARPAVKSSAPAPPAPAAKRAAPETPAQPAVAKPVAPPPAPSPAAGDAASDASIARLERRLAEARDDSERDWLNLMLGLAHFQARHWKEARECVDRVLAKDPQNASAIELKKNLDRIPNP